MQISVIHPSELGATEIDAWNSFQDKTEALANPFLSPDFTIAVGRLRPGARVAVLSEGPELVGFFPFERRPLGVGTPIAAGLTDCQGLVHAPGADWDPRMLLRACGVSVWRFDHLVAGQQPFERYQTALATSPIINLAAGYEAYYAALKNSSPKFCSGLLRKTRKLQRDAGEIRFDVSSTDVGDLRALMRWKSDQYRRTGRLDRFSHPWIVELVETLLTTRSEKFSGLLSVVRAGDLPVAAHFGLRYGPVLSDWFPAYDTQFRRYSPGLILHLRMAEALAADGLERIDLGRGVKAYKESLKSYDNFVGEGIVSRRSPLAALNYVRSAPVSWAVRQIRRYPPLFNVADTLLRKGARIHCLLRPRVPAADVPAGPPAATARPAQQAGTEAHRASTGMSAMH